jgi:hypothetical protein
MSTTLTLPNRKNVNLAFTSGSSTSLTSSLERGVTTLQVNRPQGFSTSGLEDAVTLESILADAEIAFQADGQGFTDTDEVTLWTNNGTLGSNYNVQNTTGSRTPSFTATGGSFTKTGALEFKDHSSSSSSEYLRFSEVAYASSSAGGYTHQEAFDITYGSDYDTGGADYSGNDNFTGGPFCIYQVFSYGAGYNATWPPAVTSMLVSDLTPSSPVWNDPPGSGVPPVFFQPTSYAPALQFESNDLNIWSRFGSSASFTLSPNYEERDLSEGVQSDKPFVHVIYRGGNNDIYVYDENGAQIGYQAANSFVYNWDGYTNANDASFPFQFGAFGRYGGLGASRYSIHKPANNVPSYIAAFGVINKDITKIKAQNLGRLLGEKYLP